MKILNLLISGERIFLSDDIESKKIKGLVDATNNSFAEMSGKIKDFEAFTASQLDGEYHDRLVMAKSLKAYYPDWQAVTLANENLAKEETLKIESYNSAKEKLLNNLKNLLKESTKEAVVSNYDLFDNEYQKCEPGHEVIILGTHGNNIINSMITELDRSLSAVGHFNEIKGTTLEANYTKVNQNVEKCKINNSNMYAIKQNKHSKIFSAIKVMNELAVKIVFFETYKEALLDIGCNPKLIKAYENTLTKQYIPLKKSLQKELKFEFDDICNLTINEDPFPTTDIDDEADGEDIGTFGGLNSTNNQPQFNSATYNQNLNSYVDDDEYDDDDEDNVEYDEPNNEDSQNINTQLAQDEITDSLLDSKINTNSMDNNNSDNTQAIDFDNLLNNFSSPLETNFSSDSLDLQPNEDSNKNNDDTLEDLNNSNINTEETNLVSDETIVSESTTEQSQNSEAETQNINKDKLKNMFEALTKRNDK